MSGAPGAREVWSALTGAAEQRADDVPVERSQPGAPLVPAPLGMALVRAHPTTLAIIMIHGPASELQSLRRRAGLCVSG